MFAFKKKYFLIIESIKDINIRNIKYSNKFLIIYRNRNYKEKIADLVQFRKQCRLKKVQFFVANDLRLSIFLKADGVYLSSYNKSYKPLFLKSLNFKIIGSAHNYKEIFTKLKQGCKYILLSKLFIVRYNKKAKTLGVTKFNNYLNNIFEGLVPLGGITSLNLNTLKTVNCEAFSLFSEIKKKPAKIINRLF